MTHFYKVYSGKKIRIRKITIQFLAVNIFDHLLNGVTGILVAQLILQNKLSQVTHQMVVLGASVLLVMPLAQSPRAPHFGYVHRLSDQRSSFL
jgi:hypothetical protein